MTQRNSGSLFFCRSGAVVALALLAALNADAATNLVMVCDETGAETKNSSDKPCGNRVWRTPKAGDYVMSSSDVQTSEQPAWGNADSRYRAWDVLTATNKVLRCTLDLTDPTNYALQNCKTAQQWTQFAGSTPQPSLGTLTLTFSSAVDADGVTPTLTWTTAPEAKRCEARGAWTGDKAIAGSETLAKVQTTTTYGMECWWGESSAKLTWTPPTQNTDGTTLTNLGGYRILYGQAADQLTQTLAVANPGAASQTITGLATGTWYFGVRAFNTTGQESDTSALVSKTLTDVAQSRSVDVTVTPAPKGPSGVAVE